MAEGGCGCGCDGACIVAFWKAASHPPSHPVQSPSHPVTQSTAGTCPTLQGQLTGRRGHLGHRTRALGFGGTRAVSLLTVLLLVVEELLRDWTDARCRPPSITVQLHRHHTKYCSAYYYLWLAAVAPRPQLPNRSPCRPRWALVCKLRKEATRTQYCMPLRGS